MQFSQFEFEISTKDDTFKLSVALFITDKRIERGKELSCLFVVDEVFGFFQEVHASHEASQIVRISRFMVVVKNHHC